MSALIFCCLGVRANTILGVFSDPVLMGSVANDPAAGQSTFFDNSGTATYFIDNLNDPTVGGTPPQQQNGNFVLWGTGDASEIDFFGAQIPADPSMPFQIGTFTYTNANSALNQLVFGFTISFYDTAVGPTSFLGSDQIIITTTQDITGGPPGDDDYLNICGSLSNICGSSIEAVETDEGGAGVTVNLIGSIVGDPTLNINSVAVAPLSNFGIPQNGTANGFIGTDPPIGAIGAPEPGSWMLALGGVVLLGAARIYKESRANSR